MNILYVEDEPMDSDMVKREFARNAPQHTVKVVTTYHAALAALEAPAAFDLILTDYHLPDGDGLGLLAHVRARDLPFAVVIITGAGDEETAVAMLKAGADDYVVKRGDYVSRLPVILEDALAHYRGQAMHRVRPLHVLYAEHNTTDVDLTRRHLAAHAPHIHLEIAETASEALQKIPAHTPQDAYDVLLLDYRLSGMNALEMLKEVRQARRLDIPIVLVTGTGSDEVALQALKLGAADYMVKNAGYLYRLPAVLENAFHHSQLRREQSALKESERKLREAQTLGRIGNWEFDIESNTLDWSAQTYALYERDPALGPPTPEEEAAYYTSEQTRVLREYARRAISEGKEFAYDLQATLPSGTQAYFSATLRPMRDEKGRVIRLFGTVQDITERKRTEEAEREQRTLAEALRDTAAALASTLSFDEVLDRILAEVGRVLPLDGSTIMLVGGDKARIVRARGYAERGQGDWVLTVSLPIAQTANLQRMFDTGRPLAIPDTRNYPGWVQLPEVPWVRSYAGAPVRMKGQVIGFLNLDSVMPGFFTPAHAERLQAFADQAGVALENARLYDEVRRHAAELEQRVAERTAELRSANEQLQRLSRLKSEFVSNVSHELRTPLSNIKTYLWLLEKGKPEKHAKYMETLHREAELLQSLIEDLLHLSRLDLGKVKPALAPVDVNRVVTLLVSDRATLFADRGLTLAARVEPDLPLIQADEKMLIQVLTNLMTNAMNYTPAGGVVTVSTGLRISDWGLQIEPPQSAIPNPQWVTFSVSDTGPGISAEEQAHLFERFYRGEAARQTRAPGTGLGLAICMELIERHGGKLTLESQLGAGSTFTVWLPAGGDAVTR